MPQLGLRDQPAGRMQGFLFGVEHDVGDSALAAIHRRVRAAQEFLDVVAVLGLQGDAEARLDPEQCAVNLEKQHNEMLL